MGRAGNESCVAPLVQMALDSDAELAQTAKAALIELPGTNVDQDIVARLHGAQGKILPLLIELVGERRVKAVEELVTALDNSDNTVRVAALKALGTTVPADKLSILIAQLVSPKHEEDTAEAEHALKVASVRMPDREACAKELAAAMEHASVPTKIALLKIVGAVGGIEALASIGAAARANDPELQDASSRLLGEWMTADAAPVLLDLAKTAPGEKYRVRALRGYIRIARQFVMTEPQRCEMCQNAMTAATQPAEQKLVLDVLKLKKYQSLATLQLVAKFTKDFPKLNKEATQAALFIARDLGDEKHSGSADEVKDILSHARLEKVKLEIVSAEFGAPGKQKDVTKTLQKQATDVQLISFAVAQLRCGLWRGPGPGRSEAVKGSVQNQRQGGRRDVRGEFSDHSAHAQVNPAAVPWASSWS